MQTKINAAWLAGPQQDAFGDLKNIDLQFVVLADGVVDIPT